MQLSDRAFLTQHIEAVWGVALPPDEVNEVELLSESLRPHWQLCAADLRDAQVLIWQTGLSQAERAGLLHRLDDAQHLPATDLLPPGIGREIALRLNRPARIDLATAHQTARVLTTEDYPLLAIAWPSEAASLQEATCAPLVGVIQDGKLLCLAHSSRRTTQACELGVDTLPCVRRQGYALAATIVWAATVQHEGLTPIYSALAANTASLALASAAGYSEVARVTTIAAV